MLNLNSKIIIYETDDALQPTSTSYEFRYVKDIRINSNYETLTDTATIQMPKKINTNFLSAQEAFDVVVNTLDSSNKSIHDFFKLDYFIEIFLGYNGDYKPAFRGYITEVKGDAPITIECQDLMYACKKQKVVTTEPPKIDDDPKNITSQNPTITVKKDIKGFIENRLNELQVPFDVALEIEDLGELLIKREWSICQLFDALKEKHKVFSYFELGDTKNTLRVTNNPAKFSRNELNQVVDKYLIDIPIPGLGGLGSIISSGINSLTSSLLNLIPSQLFGGRPKFRFFDTIIHDNLKVTREDVKNVRLRVEKYLANSNTPIYTEMGDPEGQLIGTWTLHDNETIIPDDEFSSKNVLKKVQEELRDYITPRIALERTTGLSGTFTTFGEPFVRPTDSVELSNAEDPEKNGVFQVKSVVRTYGTGGYRQEIELGRQVNEN